MLSDFDTTFTSKIKTYFSNTIFANTAIVYNVAFNLVDDPTVVLKFPLVSIYRPTGFEPVEVQTFAARKRGMGYIISDDEKHFGYTRYITVNLPYQLDIYAKSQEALNRITEEIMHALSLDSTITVSQYDSNTKQHYIDKYNITYSSGPTEQSEFQDGDRVYHYALLYTIDNARLVNFKEEIAVVDVEISEGIKEE